MMMMMMNAREASESLVLTPLLRAPRSSRHSFIHLFIYLFIQVNDFIKTGSFAVAYFVLS